MLALKKKKAFEQQLNQLSGSRLTIETQIMAIENATITYSTLNSISTGSQVLRQLNNNMDVDDVQDTLDNIQEQIDVTKQIGEVLSEPLGLDIDEKELEDELEKLMEEDMDEKFKDINVPKNKVRVEREVPQSEPEDDDFAQLEEELGL